MKPFERLGQVVDDARRVAKRLKLRSFARHRKQREVRENA